MKVLAVLPLVTAYQVLETSNTVDVAGGKTYDGMKATLKGISAMQVKGDIDAGTIKIVQDMLDSIEGSMMDGLACDVNSTQTMLDNAENAIIKCDTDRADWKADVWSVHNTDVSDADTTHSGCRTEEAGACADSTDACDAYVERVKSWRKCVRPADDRFLTSDNDDIFEYLCCLEDFFEEQVPATGDTFYTDRTSCETKYDAWCAKMIDCDAKQGTFEATFCTRETAVEDYCGQYRRCRNGAQKTYGEVLEEVRSLEEIYRAQRVALDCLVCYGNMILNNETDLTSCDEVKECTELSGCPTITYPTIDPCVPCTDMPNLRAPCTAEFISDFYATYEGTCTPPTQCVSCAERDSSFSQGEKDLVCDPIPV